MNMTWINRAGRGVWPLWMLVAACAAYAAWAYTSIEEDTVYSPPVAAASVWPNAEPPEPEAWQVFRAENNERPGVGPLHGRFRLAGTFTSMSGGGDDASNRMAIVDDLQQDEQHLVREGDKLGRVLVRRIYPQRIILSEDGREEEIRLSFSDAPDDASAVDAADAEEAQVEVALEVNRFGKRVAENRWVFKREAIMDYYRTMLDHPERAVLLYESLKPDYNEHREIEGYELDMVGEETFFNDVGLRQGDVVRKVNSMRMSSQNRAEYFISEFAQDRLSAVVIDIEREGEARKLVYMLR